jgi:hypothetical protein
MTLKMIALDLPVLSVGCATAETAADTCSLFKALSSHLTYCPGTAPYASETCTRQYLHIPIFGI